MLEDQKTRGRPRKWATEAERKRAYRERRAAELAHPHELREETKSLRAAANSVRAAEKQAKEQAASWRMRAERAERRAELARRRTRVAELAAQRARAERDQAQRLLRNKLHWSRDARPLRNDPDSLLALIADLRRELEEQRRHLARAKQLLAIADQSDRW